MPISSLVTPTVSLLAVLLLIVLAGRVARRTRFVSSGSSAGRRLAVQETLALDTRRRLILVRCDGRSLLLLTGVQDQVVGWVPESIP